MNKRDKPPFSVGFYGFNLDVSHLADATIGAEGGSLRFPGPDRFAELEESPERIPGRDSPLELVVDSEDGSDH